LRIALRVFVPSDLIERGALDRRMRQSGAPSACARSNTSSARPGARLSSTEGGKSAAG
jgi:hypothetical protein